MTRGWTAALILLATPFVQGQAQLPAQTESALIKSAPAKQPRVLSVGSSMTELVFALDAQAQLVAVDSTSVLPEGSTLSRLGYHRQLSAEGMLSTQATLVIGSDEMGPVSALNLVRQAGIQVESLPEAMTVEQLQSNILRLGQLLDRDSQAATLEQEVATRAARLQTAQPKLGKKTLFLLLGEGNTLQVAGRNTLADHLIRLSGGQNLAAESLDGYKPVALEALVAMAPEVILVSRRHLDDAAGPASLFKQFPLLKHTPAGINNAIVPINGKALIGGLGLSTLAEAERLHQNWLATP